MKVTSRVNSRNSRKVRIVEPAVQGPDEERRWQEVRKFARLISQEPEPNLGRVREIKEEIKKGTYPTKEMIEEAATQLAIRFMKKE